MTTTTLTTPIAERISALTWAELHDALDEHGFVQTPAVLSAPECRELAGLYETGRFRSTIAMARHRFGEGEYRYFDHPLPDPSRGLLYEPWFGACEDGGGPMTFPTGPERPQDQRPRLAGWWTRVGAVLIDALIMVPIALFAAIVSVIAAAPFGGSSDLGAPLWLLLAFVFISAYYVLLMKRAGAQNGQTLGKQAVGIKVVRDDGAPVTTKLVLLREVLLKFIVGNVTFALGGLIDSLWPLVDRENRALHDMVVKTHVVEVRTHAVQARPRSQPQQPQPALAPAIARHLYAAQTTETRIREAVDRAALPYTDVCNEVDSLVRLMHESARRAQLLHEALAETPVTKVEQRLRELAGSGKTSLVDALNQQLLVQRRMQAQLDRYGDEMERVVVELDTVRGSLLSVSASTDVANQQRMADEVRGLRDEMGAVAEGMSAAYDRH